MHILEFQLTLVKLSVKWIGTSNATLMMMIRITISALTTTEHDENTPI